MVGQKRGKTLVAKKTAITTWEELQNIMDKRYIPKDFPEAVKEQYGRRPNREKVHHQHHNKSLTCPQLYQKKTEKIVHTDPIVGVLSKIIMKSDPAKEAQPEAIEKTCLKKSKEAAKEDLF
ncbi:hypothetical protein YC2023_045527 [Brassica napus]